MSQILIEAYHGTSREAANDILTNSFNESVKVDEWLGHGIYFFVPGVSDPVENSKQWATAQAWNAEQKVNNYTHMSVLKANVELEADRVVDITETSGLAAFNEIKEQLFDKIFDNFRFLRDNPSQHNCILFNFVVDTLDAHAVKHNLYIKNVRERKLKLRLHVPNTTVLCVRKAKFKAGVDKIYDGEIR